MSTFTGQVIRIPETADPKSEPTSDAGGFLSRRTVAKLFGVSASTITRWARTGLIAARRTPGGHYRYRAEDVARAAISCGAVEDA